MFRASTVDDCSLPEQQQQQQQQQQQHQVQVQRQNLNSWEQSCCDLNEGSRESCTESDAFLILGEFEKLYKNRLAEVETGADVSGTPVSELKLKIMKDWVEDLGDQNKMLIKTVHELEQAATSRVKLLENKLQETSTLISHNTSHLDKSEDPKVLSNHTNMLLHDQNDAELKVNYLQNDVTNLLKLIKQGRQENNWDLNGMKFYLIRPSDIAEPLNCSCCQIPTLFNNEERAAVENLQEELYVIKEEMKKLKDKHQYEVNNFLFNIDEKDKEIEQLVARLASLKKENKFNKVDQDFISLTKDVKHKKTLIHDLRNKVEHLTEKCRYKDIIISELRNELKIMFKKNEENLENTNVNQLHNSTTKQLEELKRSLVLKDNELSKLQTILSEQCNKMDRNFPFNVYTNNENQIQLYSSNIIESISKDDILSLKMENESILKQLQNVESMHKMEISVANEKLQDVKDILCNYKSAFIEQNKYTENIKEFVTAIENKIVYIQNLFQNKCEMCAKENLISEIKEIMSKVTSGICTLSKIYENTNKSAAIENITIPNDVICKKKIIPEYEQKAIDAVNVQQIRMMEEFRICTVEVQAATEDLREEMALVISNLNSRHSNYIELTTMVSQVQDYLTETRENISEVINRLELQDEEGVRNTERITNNRVRLKDMKNEFNQTQSELSKCLNNVHSNIQQTNLLGYAEIHTCNNLLISLIEEVEQIVSNLHNFQSQRCCTLSTMTELKKQLIITESIVKTLKQKSDHVLLENESAQKYFTERLEHLEKYECEVDNCHTKMYDALQTIDAIRNQMNKFGCWKEYEYSFQNTNETIKLKDDLRRLHKEFEQLKLKQLQSSLEDKQDKMELIWESRETELQDEIKLLNIEIKFKEDANTRLREIIESLEKELDHVRTKAENYRKCSSLQSLELKKKIIELENCQKVQKDAENNLACTVNDDTDSDKLQFLDHTNKDKLYSGTIGGLQGLYENLNQLIKVCQGTIQTIKNSLQELGNEYETLVPQTVSHSCSSIRSVKAVIEILTKYMDRIRCCSSEIEKIKSSLHSKTKLIENMEEIIRIQKDSISISQLEVENLHKKLNDKISIQEQAIFHCEKENGKLNEKIELQVQTINHLQGSVVEAKKTIDQLNKKAASDNYNKTQIIKSLNLHLAETETQYKDCYGEASKQSALLELQRDSISNLHKKIKFLEFHEFFNVFTLHFIYCIIIFKYQKEFQSQKLKVTDIQLQMNELSNVNYCLKKQCSSIQYKYQEAIEEMKILKKSFKNSEKKLICEKECEINTLSKENSDLKNELKVYKFDFDLIQEEMKEMGIKNSSIQTFKTEIETIRSENKNYRCNIEDSKQMIENLEHERDCLKKNIHDLERINNENYKEKNRLQNEVLKNEIEKRTKLKEENKILKKNNEILKAQMDVIEEESKNDKYFLEKQLDDKKCELSEIQQSYEKALQDLNKNLLSSHTLVNQEICNCKELVLKNEHKKLSESEKKLSKDLEDSKEKFDKSENYERTYQRQKDEIMLLKKKLIFANQQLLNCNVTREDMIRQNKLLEDNNNKSMAELEDIVLQLEEMQSSLAKLKDQCDAKTQSLEYVSVELARMKKSKIENCEESKYVLHCVRVWIKQQKDMIANLQEQLAEKQHQLSRISSEKKKLLIRMKRLMRENKILTKGLKFIRRQTSNKQIIGLEYLPLRQIQILPFKEKNGLRNGFYSSYSNNKQSNAIYSHFKRECREKSNCTEDNIRMQGDSKLFSTLEYLTEKIPKTSQINNTQIEKRSHEDRSDYVYQTSSKMQRTQMLDNND